MPFDPESTYSFTSNRHAIFDIELTETFHWTQKHIFRKTIVNHLHLIYFYLTLQYLAFDTWPLQWIVIFDSDFTPSDHRPTHVLDIMIRSEYGVRYLCARPLLCLPP